MTITKTRTAVNSNGARLSLAGAAVEGSSMLEIAEAIASDATNAVVGCVIDVSALKSFTLATSVDTTIIAKATGGATVNTWTLLAGQALDWQDGDADACPLSGDIATLDITNDSDPAAAGTLNVWALTDATP